jgi:hypothetical protein
MAGRLKVAAVELNTETYSYLRKLQDKSCQLKCAACWTIGMFSRDFETAVLNVLWSNACSVPVHLWRVKQLNRKSVCKIILRTNIFIWTIIVLFWFLETEIKVGITELFDFVHCPVFKKTMDRVHKPGNSYCYEYAPPSESCLNIIWCWVCSRGQHFTELCCALQFFSHWPMEDLILMKYCEKHV